MQKIITLVGPQHVPPTDGMIIRGTINLLTEACDNAEIHYLPFSESSTQDQMPHPDTTHLIVTGTPWLWDQCYLSNKYNSFKEIRARVPNAKVMFLGIGSCYTKGQEYNTKMKLIEAKAQLQAFFRDATIITRDPWAYMTLDECEIASLLYTCPAYYAAANYTPTEVLQTQATLFFYDPRYTLGISRTAWSEVDRDNLIKQQLIFAQLKNATTYCVDNFELEIANSLGLKPVLLRTTDEAFEVINKSHLIMSGRIHLAIPALALNKKVIPLAIDSRVETFYEAQEADTVYDKAMLILKLSQFLE